MLRYGNSSDISGCSFGDSFLIIDSLTPGFGPIFSLNVHANPGVQTGSHTLACTWQGQTITGNAPGNAHLTVYDATPLTDVEPAAVSPGTPPAIVSQGGLATIIGKNFGQTGTLQLCDLNGNNCNTIPWTTWSSSQITAQINGSPGQKYTVKVTSGGSQGTGFLADPSLTSADSNTWEVDVAAPPAAQITRTVAQSGGGQTTSVVSGNDATHPFVVSVGEQVTLHGSVTGLPAGISIQGQSWTVPGTRVGNYVQAVASATVTSFAPPNAADVTFYWTDVFQSPPGAKAVTYTATLTDGTPVLATAWFLVVRPDTITFTSQTTTAGINVSAANNQQVLGLNFGTTASNGITWAMSASSGIGGRFQLVQVINYTNTYTNPDGSQKTRTTSGACTPSTQSPCFVLDDGAGTVAYGGQVVPGLDQPPLGSGTAQFNLDDLPFIGLQGASFSAITTSQAFQTYFMYQPPAANSIWVTLATMSWNWAGSASLQNGTWTVGPPANQTFTANPVGQDSTALPLWTNSASKIPQAQ